MAKNHNNNHFFNANFLTEKTADLISEFKATVALGYSDDNWARVASIYQDLQGLLSNQELQVLGEAWRNTYADDNFIEKVMAL